MKLKHLTVTHSSGVISIIQDVVSFVLEPDENGYTANRLVVNRANGRYIHAYHNLTALRVREGREP